MCRSKSFSFYEWRYVFIFKVIIKHSNSSIVFFANMYYLKEILVWSMFHLYREIYSRWEYLEITLFLILKYKLGSLFSIFVMERTFFSFFSFPDNFIHRILQVEILSTYNLAKKNNYFCSHAFFLTWIPIQNSHMYLCMYMYICMHV